MSATENLYTLYYTVPADNIAGVFPFKREADTLIEALSTAWVTRQAGDDITGIAYRNQVLFRGKDLQKILDSLTEHGAQLGVPPTDIVRRILPEALAERLYRAEQYATECLGEAAVYRELLETCYKAATKASETGDVKFLHTEMTLHHFNVPDSDQARTWGKDFVYAYSRDASWLHTAKKALERIRADAEKLPESEAKAIALKKSILDAAEEGLIPHI